MSSYSVSWRPDQPPYADALMRAGEPPVTVARAFVTLVLASLVACTGNNTRPSSGEAPTAPVASLSEACKTTLVNCRGPGSVRLRKNDGSFFELSWELNQPVVQSDTWVTIFPGEKIYLEAELSGDSIAKVRAVPTVEHPEKTITLSFSQSNDSTDMMLSVSNPFDRHLKYRLGMEVLDRDGLFKTSSCPAIAKGGGFEHWGHPIFQLVVTDFRLIPKDSDQMTCE